MPDQEQIANLVIDIKANNVDTTIAKLQSLIAKLQILETLARKLNFVDLHDGFITAAEGANALAESIGKINIKPMEEATKKANELADALGKAAKKDKGSKEDKSDKAFLQLGQQLGVVDGKAVSIVTTLSKIAPALESAILPVGIIAGSFTLIAKGVKFAWNETKKFASFLAKGLKSAADAAVKGIKKKIDEIKAPFEKLFDRILRTTLNRAIRFALNQIGTAFAEGVKNVARGMDSANKVLSAYATRLMYLKNTLGAAVIPLLTALQPLFMNITNAVIKATNAINQFLSLLNGKKTYIQAKEQYVDYAASLDKSSKKAKKSIDKLTTSFDELHDITATATSSTKDEEDYTKYFTTAGIESDISSFYKKIVDGFKKGDLTQVGYILASKLNIAVANIQDKVRWDTVGEKIAKRMRSLASLVTTLVNEINFENIGLTFAEGLNTIVRAVNTFTEQLFTDNTFVNFGENIAMMLYTAIANVDWKAVGTFFLDKLIGIFDVLKGFTNKMLEPIDTVTKDGAKVTKPRIVVMVGNIMTGFSDALEAALNSGRVTELGQTVGDFIIMIFEAGAAIFTESSFWENLAKAVNEVIKQITGNPKLIPSITNFVKSVVNMVATFLRTADLGKILESISKVIDTLMADPEFKEDLRSASEEIGNLAGQWAAIKFEAWIRTLPSMIWNATKGFFLGINRTNEGIAERVTIKKKNAFRRSGTGGTFATGGFPEDGVFFANHTELVGKFSNGKTAVANNSEITTSIYQAVRDAMKDSGGSGGGVGDVYFDTHKVGKHIAKSVFNEANRAGYKLRSVKA